jgi:hypothetical protein
MAILNNSNAISSGGYDINNSLRFRASASAYLNRTPGSAGNQQIFTWSGWVKRGQLSSEQAIIVCRTGSNAAFGRLVFTSGDALQFFARNSSSTTTALLNTTQVFRDPSAWYHIVLAVDTTQATAANRIKFYVNGTQITAFSTATYPSQNTNLDFNTTADTYIGVEIPNAIYFDGYMAEVNFVNAQQLTPSSFGETDTTTGSWKPKAYTGTYGTNGFELNFSDIATTSGSNAGLGKDFSGNANYWTTNNISVTAGTTYDAMIDSPTLTSATVANYATWNPLSKTAGTLVLSAANLKLADGSASSRCNSTMQVSSGKWYFETTLTTAGSNTTVGIGQGNITDQYPGQDALSYAQTLETATSINNNTQPSYGTSLTTGDIFMCAFDLDNNKLFFGKNGTWFGSSNPATGANPVYTLTAGSYGAIARPYTTGATIDINFGQRPFSYTPPTGFVRLNTYNLPDSTIKKGNTVMDATLYTGNSTTNTITNAAGFKPDLVWVKSRNTAGANHNLWDSVRGAGKALFSNLTDAEGTAANMTGFSANGFTFSGVAYDSNSTGNNLVGWQWQAGQGSTSSNTSGTITSTTSVNATAGFSVVTYTGTGANATVGHGLGVAPKWFFIKARVAAVNWTSYHEPLGNTAGLHLNTTGGSDVNSGFFNNTSPTSSTIAIGSGSTVNTNGGTYVAYCWAEIAGFSKFGSYTGNGSADGPFVYLGFRPKFVMIKQTNTAANWIIMDGTRSPANEVILSLQPNTSNAEESGFANEDFLSNGFKLRTTNATWNGSGGTFIYAAFAENPFKNALAR